MQDNQLFQSLIMNTTLLLLLLLQLLKDEQRITAAKERSQGHLETRVILLKAVNVIAVMVLLMPWLVKTISKSDCIACDSRVPRDIGQSIRHKDVIFEACNYVQSVFDVYNVYDDESHWPIYTGCFF